MVVSLLFRAEHGTPSNSSFTALLPQLTYRIVAQQREQHKQAVQQCSTGGQAGRSLLTESTAVELPGSRGRCGAGSRCSQGTPSAPPSCSPCPHAAGGEQAERRAGRVRGCLVSWEHPCTDPAGAGKQVQATAAVSPSVACACCGRRAGCVIRFSPGAGGSGAPANDCQITEMCGLGGWSRRPRERRAAHACAGMWRHVTASTLQLPRQAFVRASLQAARLPRNLQIGRAGRADQHSSQWGRAAV